MSRSAIGSLSRLGRRGTTALEMALTAPLFVLLLAGGAEIGRYVFVSESVKYVVGEVARAAVINPTAISDWSAVIAKAPILKASDFTTLTVTVQPPQAPAVLTTVEVRASYRYTFDLLPLSAAATKIDNLVRIPFVLPP